MVTVISSLTLDRHSAISKCQKLTCTKPTNDNNVIIAYILLYYHYHHTQHLLCCKRKLMI